MPDPDLKDGCLVPLAYLAIALLGFAALLGFLHLDVSWPS